MSTIMVVGGAGYVGSVLVEDQPISPGGSLEVCGGDNDCDGDVDLDDYIDFCACLTGCGGGIDPGCSRFDFDTDGDVDLADFAVFAASFTGPL